MFSAISVLGNGLYATATSGRLALDPIVSFVVSAVPAVALPQGSHLFVLMLSAPASRPDIRAAVAAANRTRPAHAYGHPTHDGGKASQGLRGSRRGAPRAFRRTRQRCEPVASICTSERRSLGAANQGRRGSGGGSAGDRRRPGHLARRVPTNRSTATGRTARHRPRTRPAHGTTMRLHPGSCPRGISASADVQQPEGNRHRPGVEAGQRGLEL